MLNIRMSHMITTIGPDPLLRVQTAVVSYLMVSSRVHTTPSPTTLYQHLRCPIHSTPPLFYTRGIATTHRSPTACLALVLARPPRLPVAGAHVTPPEGGSPVGGHGDVLARGRRGP
jgi:hypothetical protein